jgi:ribosome-binding ATPase YchF (GTP1/OBG family)
MQKKNIAEAIATQFSGLKVNVEDVKSVLRKVSFDPEKPSSWTDSQIKEIAQSIRKHTKPMVIAANKRDRPQTAQSISQR